VLRTLLARLSEDGVPAARVVERFVVVEDGELGLAARGESAGWLLIEQFALERREQAFGERVVVAVGDAAPPGRRDDAIRAPARERCTRRRGRCDG
jgi:hypothetical protein